MIYRPREDSHLIEKEVKKYANGKKVLDVGSGSGIQAKAALESGAKSVLCVDIDYDAVNLLKKKGLDAIQSDLFKKVKGKFDLIIFNPPYLPYAKEEDDNSSLHTSGGKTGDEIIVKFLNNVKKYLNENGKILLVVSSLTPISRILNILKNKKLHRKIIAQERFFMEKLEVWEIMDKK
ncbi:MAG: HemK2/MTQ2 family protein methyltransferase [Nanoarchaeota archaeon]